MLRILVFAYAAVWTVVRAPHLLDAIDLAPRRFDGIGPLWWLNEPAPALAIIAAVALTPIACGAAALGWRYRASSLTAVVGFLFLTTYRNSWGQIFHTENLAALHMGVLALVPAAAACWSMGKAERALHKTETDHEALSSAVLKALSVLTVGTYFLAGIAKLRISGFGWIDGDVLRHQIAFDNARKELLGDPKAPFGALMLRNSWTLAPAAIAAIVVELAAPLALVGRRIAWIWAGMAMVFHFAILAVMAIVFPYHLLGIALSPLLPIERLGTAVAGWHCRFRRRSMRLRSTG
ncbi:MAG: HTTM domain-containing protein [Acidimicrobiaceae bacterium]|nr:HTTM domain-containing protein [Acidimicrobiaceae bacterium]